MTVLFSVGSSARLNGGSILINGLGDSITATAAVATRIPSTIPGWKQNEVIPARTLRRNGDYLFFTVAGGTTAGSGSGPSRGSLSDGTVTWTIRNVFNNVNNNCYLYWAEVFSNGRLRWDTETGYNGTQEGIVKAIVVNGGSNYSNPSLVSLDGTEATFTVVNGVITAINITSPGVLPTPSSFPTITDSTGSGAVISWVVYASGTFGVPGSTTAGMIARLPDVIASKNDIIVVHGGTNDVVAGTDATTIFNNLVTCYESLMRAGKYVIAVPILPRSGRTVTQQRNIHRINNNIVAYCQRQAYANPRNLRNIVLADPRVYLTDGNSDNVPIGGSSNVVGAMTYDGLHPNGRGAFYMGRVIWDAAQTWVAPAQLSGMRSASAFDGYDAINNPTGNMLDAYPWEASTAYNLGDSVRNDTTRIYYCIGAGTSAGSGGPTGTGATIADGTVTWAYTRLAGMSAFNSGVGSAPSAAAGVTITGNLAGGYFMQRNSGTASGTLAASIESPWSNGQVGSRQVLTFSLGLGGTTDLWVLQFGSYDYRRYGLLPADLNNTLVEFEVELEVSNLLNCNGLYLALQSNYASLTDYNIAQVGTNGGGTTLNATLVNSSGEMLTYPNGGLITMKTKPIVLPSDLESLATWLFFQFNASGGAGTATGTFKINRFALRKVLP